MIDNTNPNGKPPHLRLVGKDEELPAAKTAADFEGGSPDWAYARIRENIAATEELLAELEAAHAMPPSPEGERLIGMCHRQLGRIAAQSHRVCTNALCGGEDPVGVDEAAL